MNRFIFLIIYFLNMSLFSSEKNENFKKEIIIKKVSHTLVFEKLKYSTKINFYLQNKLIGSLSYIQKKEKEKYEIIYLFIYNEFRGKGYGKILLHIICNQLFNDGASEIFASLLPFEKIDDAEFFCLDDESEERLCEFYKKCGFKRDSLGNMFIKKSENENNSFCFNNF